MNVLAIGAHPDDIDVCCGGTLIRFIQSGSRVVIAVMTDGRASPRGDPQAAAAMRHAEAQSSADSIGAELAWMGFPDGQLADTPETRRAVTALIMRVSPDLIITESPEDYHSDHITTSRLVTACVETASWSPPMDIPGSPLGRHVPVAFIPPTKGINFTPEDYVDISDVWQQKLKMVGSHRSQYLPGPDYSLSQVREPLDEYGLYRYTRIMDEYYGQCCSVRYAEAFRWWRASNRLLPRRMLP